VLRADVLARVLIVGQAPGTACTRPASLERPERRPAARLAGVDREVFYDERRFAIIPAGLCYRTRALGRPAARPECAPRWHPPLRALLPRIELTLLVGQYAQLTTSVRGAQATLTATVHAWREYLPASLPLPHPSPRNTRWLQVNPWSRGGAAPGCASASQLLSS